MNARVGAKTPIEFPLWQSAALDGSWQAVIEE